jgi:hypothetical protein
MPDEENPAEEAVEPAEVRSEVGIRLSAMIDTDAGPKIGIIDEETKASSWLAAGDTYKNLTIIEIMYETETVRLLFAGEERVISLQGDPNALVLVPNLTAPVGEEEGAYVPNLPSEPGVQSVLRADQGVANLAVHPEYPRVVVMEYGGKKYALPSEVADAMLSNPEMSDQAKVNVIMSFPGLAEWRPGENPEAAMDEAMKKSMPPPPPSDLVIPPFPGMPAPGREPAKP